MVERKEELERNGIKLYIKNSKVIRVGRKGEQSLRITCDGEQLVQVKLFKLYEYWCVIFDRDERIYQETTNRVRKVNSVYYTINKTLVGKRVSR